MAEWAESRGHSVTRTELWREDNKVPSLPDQTAFDFLVVLGGPMSVDQDAEYPWLPAERDFIRRALTTGSRALGICLGAQLFATALGAAVRSAPHKEIGWYPVELTPAGRRLTLFDGFPARFEALHWHGDMFEIPGEAVWAASSAACPHQAFVIDQGRVVGLQFHLEETPDSLSVLVENAGHELAGEKGPNAPTGPWVATRDELLSAGAPYATCRDLLFRLLDRMMCI